MALTPGSKLGPYEILGPLGAGGMGEVYRARDSRLGREVAVKVLPESMAADPDRLARFEREARTLAAVNHPNIVTIYAVENAGGVRLLAMELVEGETLDRAVAAGGVPLTRFFEIALPMADAIAAAHERGIVHRDLKPANVMLTREGRVKVLDFGLAKLALQATGEDDVTMTAAKQPPLTVEGSILGTVAYMSPEQVRGAALDPRSDVFSLGVVLHEMLTGQRPFRGASTIDLMSAILRDPPAPLEAARDDLPQQLAKTVLRCLEKRPQDRYPSSREVFEDLRELQRDPAQSASHAPETAPPSAPEESRPTVAADGFWVAVLPFQFRGADPTLASLADDLAEDIATGLSRFSYLRVIARSSTLQYADKPVDVRTLDAELGARYVLEGSIRQAGSTVRFAARLVETGSGTQLWAESYDRRFQPDQTFELIDDIAPRIVSTAADMHGVLPHAMSEALRSRNVEDLSPYEAVLRSFGYVERLTDEEHATVRTCMEKAVERAPANPDALAMLSFLYAEEFKHGFNLLPGALDRALAAARSAVAAGPSSSLAYHVLAQALFFRRELDAFRNAAERAIQLNPMDGGTLAFMGILIGYAGDWDRGCELTDRAMELNPNHPGWYRFARFYRAYDRRDYRAALDEALRINLPSYFYTHMALAMAYGQLGDRDGARRALDELLTLKPDFAVTGREELAKWVGQGELLERSFDGLHKAGLAVEEAEGANESAEGSAPAGATGGGGPSTRRPVVGRDAERERLGQRLQQAEQGQGRLVLLGGEAGVGKTRLAQAILDDGRARGMLALTGRAREDESAPFVTITEVLEDLLRQAPQADLESALVNSGSELVRLLPELRRRFPDLPDLLDAPPEQQRRLLFRSVVELVTRLAATKPLVILLDDLQWADGSSLQLLDHLAPQLERLPILVIGTYRNVEADIGGPFANALAALVRQPVTERIAIKPFGPEAVSALLTELAGAPPPEEVSAVLFRNTEGNPFFVEEVFRHLAEEGRLLDDDGRWRSDAGADRLQVPDGVRLVIQHRLDRLEVSTQALLTTAAVIGVRFDLRVLEAALDDAASSVEALEEAEAARLIRADRAGSDYEFGHTLVRRTLLDALSRPRRQRIHLAVADAMERLFGERAAERAPELAWHYSRAGAVADPAKTARYLLAAGDRSLEELAADEGLNYYDEALEHQQATAPTDVAARAEIRFKRGRAQLARGDWQAARTEFEAALESFATAGNGDEIARACHELGHVEFFANRLERATELAERGLAALPGEPSIQRCRLLADLGCYLSMLGEFDRGDPLLGEAESMADALAGPELRAEVGRQRLVQQHHLIDGTGKLRAADDAIRLARQAGATWELSRSQGLALVAVVYSGQFDLAPRIEEAERLADKLGDAGTLMCVQVAQTYEHLVHGRVAAAVEQGAPMIAAMERLGGFLHHGHAHLATALYYAGDWDRAREHSALANRDVPRDAWFGFCQSAHLKLLAYLGERDEVRQMVDAHAAEVPEVGSSRPVGSWAWALAIPEALAVIDSSDRVAAFHPILVDVLQRGTLWVYNFGLVEKLAGIAAAAGGQWERAEEHFDTALRQSRELPCRVEEPEVLRWHAWAARRRGRPDDENRARALLGKAREVASELGMPRHVAIMESLLREPSGPP